MRHLTRKDLANDHTRKLWIQSAPAIELARCYRNVTDVTLTQGATCPKGLGVYQNGQTSPRISSCKLLRAFLSGLASNNDLSDPIHVDISSGLAKRYAKHVQKDAKLDKPSTSLSFKIRYWEVYLDKPTDLANLICLQPVVCLDDDCDSHQDFQELLEHLNPCFSQRQRSSNPRQLFLSGAPAIVLSPKELRASLDPVADSLLKLYQNINGTWEPTWEEFTSFIKLVGPEFWPSRSDLERGYRSVSSLIPSTEADIIDLPLLLPIARTRHRSRWEGK